jgi:predicted transcriptional regulator
VEKGRARSEVRSEHRLHFDSLETLLKALTPARWALLMRLRAKGSMSIRGLARELGRDYKNLHTDVQRLKEIGLVERGENDNVEAPWDTVEARLQLAA